MPIFLSASKKGLADSQKYAVIGIVVKLLLEYISIFFTSNIVINCFSTPLCRSINWYGCSSYVIIYHHLFFKEKWIVLPG